VMNIDSLAITRLILANEPLSSAGLLRILPPARRRAALGNSDRKEPLRLSSLECALTENAYATLAE
jgi:hypothetical protein